MNSLLSSMLAEAEARYPQEACGLVIKGTKGAVLVPCRNISDTPTESFTMHPEDYLAAQQQGEVVGIFHSHPDGLEVPSPADKVTCEATGLPWHIVSWPRAGYMLHNPNGYQAPYLGRPFVHGVLDCFALIRDWYAREFGIQMPDVPREDDWWDKGQNLYEDNYKAFGFYDVPEGAIPKLGDVFTMQLGSDTVNHAAIYVGNGLILHHVRDRLSREDVYGGMWQKHTRRHLRHTSRQEK